MTFEIRDQFYLDGAPFQIISGAIHYFRVVPEYWRHRLLMLKAMGCNTVETYVPWNIHEPEKGKFVFDGMANLGGFLDLAAELGLWAIVRPSPYICAEWEWGGLPYWLLCEDTLRLRASQGNFLAHVAAYYKVLLPRLAPRQITRGGNIILMQVENEYGGFGDDAEYLRALAWLMENGGVEVPLVTSDGPWRDDLAKGSLLGVLPTVNFGSQTAQRFAALEEHLGRLAPLMVMEFWNGWFDSWGSGHQTTNAQANAADLDMALTMGSANLYMFHGGTNFGFMNGANDYSGLTPDTTSYDYDAPLSEDGRETEKYRAFRSVIGKYRPLPEIQAPLPPRRSYGILACNGSVPLLNAAPALGQAVSATHPVGMEALGQGYGYVLYRTRLRDTREIETLRIMEAADRVTVLLDGSIQAAYFDRELGEEHKVHWSVADGMAFDLLVENLGRVNFGARLPYQRKGICGDVHLNQNFHTGWEISPLPLTAGQLARLSFGAPALSPVPAFYRFPLQADCPADTFVDMTEWGKGCVFINGFNLGRFWDIGPQRRLYLPGPLLRKGENEIIVFETEGRANLTLTLTNQPDLG